MTAGAQRILLRMQSDRASFLTASEGRIANDAVQQLLNEAFITYHMDIDRGDGYRLTRKGKEYGKEAKEQENGIT